jgi:hypothetical protein
MMGFLSTDPHAALTIDTLRMALAHGTVMASFTIESFGLDRLASLTEGELESRFDEFASMVRI